MLAIGLARRTGIELTLTKHGLGKLKSKYVAIGGIVFAIEQILIDTQSPRTADGDSLYECGVDLGERTLKDIFEKVAISEDSFDISYFDPDDPKQRRFGFEDEERKININALRGEQDNQMILQQLIMQFGYDEEQAKTIAAAVVDWRDENDDVFKSPYGAENDYYQSLSDPYPAKNGPFDSLPELLMVKGMTPEIYQNIKKYLTIYPKSSPFLLNIDTAPATVLRAVARSFTGPQTNTSFNDADALVEKILAYRQGDDGEIGTRDDRIFEVTSAGLTPLEMVLDLLMENYRVRKSDYLRVRVTGRDESSSITTNITAVVKRSDLSIIEWYRQ